MKQVTQGYADTETASTRKPVELYTLWGRAIYYLTSADAPVDFGVHTYEPAVIKRGIIETNSNLESKELEVTFSRVNPALAAYLANNPLNNMLVIIQKLFRDMDPPAATYIYVGRVKNISISGEAILVKCVAPDYFLKTQIPKMVYQPECNWTLFGTECGKNESGYKRILPVAVSEDGRTLTADWIADKPSNYYTLGYAEHQSLRSLVVEHLGTHVKLAYPLPGLENGEAAWLCAGCDGKIETCRDKFQNVSRFGGFPYIPDDNPCLWT